ncbi:MAG: hypothetical protein KDD65_11170, partial [Bacteroidetes bacterium]|nr:hypothetical protein [Bacteroidota bacterium]
MDSLDEAILERLRFEVELAGGVIPGLEQAASSVRNAGKPPAGRVNDESKAVSTEAATPNATKPEVTDLVESTELNPYERIAALIPADSPLRTFSKL